MVVRRNSSIRRYNYIPSREAINSMVDLIEKTYKHPVRLINFGHSSEEREITFDFYNGRVTVRVSPNMSGDEAIRRKREEIISQYLKVVEYEV